MNTETTFVAEITFLRYEEGGKIQPPGPPFVHYSPHLVVQNSNVRTAIKEGNNLIEDYLPVEFLEGPGLYNSGEKARFTLRLIHAQQWAYDLLLPGATFTMREGSRVIGFGTVLERNETD